MVSADFNFQYLERFELFFSKHWKLHERLYGD